MYNEILVLCILIDIFAYSCNNYSTNKTLVNNVLTHNTIV